MRFGNELVIWKALPKVVGPSTAPMITTLATPVSRASEVPAETSIESRLVVSSASSGARATVRADLIDSASLGAAPYAGVLTRHISAHHGRGRREPSGAG